MTRALSTDPILTAIENYRAGVAAFEAKPELTRDEEIAAIEETYGPPLEVLEEWDQPALSYAGAVAAIKMALEMDTDAGGDQMTINLLESALAYLEPASSEPSIMGLYRE